MTTLFVTSSGTDIGKTQVCCALLENAPATLKLRCIKPVVTGFDSGSPAASDTARLLAAQGKPIDPAAIDATSPWRFRAALSADIAAEREGRSIDFDRLVEFSRAPAEIDFNLIEGIGGVMAPIDSRHTVIDWIEALQPKILLVVGSYLGAISHTLTAIDSLRQRKLPVIGIIVSESLEQPMPVAETVTILGRHHPDTPIAIMHRNKKADALTASAWVIQLLGLD